MTVEDGFESIIQRHNEQMLRLWALPPARVGAQPPDSPTLTALRLGHFGDPLPRNYGYPSSVIRAIEASTQKGES